MQKAHNHTKVISESKKRIGKRPITEERTRMKEVVHLILDGKKKNGKPKYKSYTRHEPI